MVQDIILVVDGTLYDTYPAIVKLFHFAMRLLNAMHQMNGLLES